VSSVYYPPSLLLGRLIVYLVTISSSTVIIGNINTYFRYEDIKTKPSSIARISVFDDIYGSTIGIR